MVPLTGLRNNVPKQEKEQVRLNIEKQIMEQVRAYCAWAQIDKADDFVEQAIEYVLGKDKEWREHFGGDKGANSYAEELVSVQQ